MSDGPAPAPPPPPSRFARLSPGLIGVGVLVIALGFGLPQLVSVSAPAAPVPEPVLAPGPTPGAAVEPPTAAGIGVSLLKLVIGLAVVCGACVFLARWLGPKPPPAHAAMEVLASIAIGRCAIHLVRAGERRLLIGTDPAGVKALVELPLSEIPEPSEPVPEAAPAEPPPPAPVSHAGDEILNLLLRLRRRADAPPPG